MMQFDFLRRLFGKRERSRAREASPSPVAVKVVTASHDPLVAEAIVLLDSARALLRAAGATALAERVRVEWDSRLRTTAGLATRYLSTNQILQRFLTIQKKSE